VTETETETETESGMKSESGMHMWRGVMIDSLALSVFNTGAFGSGSGFFKYGAKRGRFANMIVMKYTKRV